MKKYILSIVALGFALTSCEEDLVVYDAGEGFVQLENSSLTTAEDGNPVVINVSLGTETNESGVSVDFETVISSGDASRFVIEPANGVLDIPAGEFTGQITITPVDNLDADGDVQLSVRLSESNSLPIGIGGLGAERVSASVTISDNDCPTEISNSYRVTVFAFNDEAPAHTVNLVPVPGVDNQWTVTSSWGPQFVAWATGDAGFANRFLYSGTITLNEDFSVDFTGNDSWATGGSGTYVACTDQFNITLTQALFTTAFTVDVVFTGQ